MIQLGEFLQIISPVIYAGALLVSIAQFSSMRKNMFIQNMQQAYASTTQALFSMFNSKDYLEMSQESSVVSQYYSLAGSPRQYYIIIQTFDMFEYLFRLYKTKMIDEEQWLRWEATGISKIVNLLIRGLLSRSILLDVANITTLAFTVFVFLILVLVNSPRSIKVYLLDVEVASCQFHLL
jgi:hypothetical protein